MMRAGRAPQAKDLGSADFQVCCIAGFQTRKPFANRTQSGVAPLFPLAAAIQAVHKLHAVLKSVGLPYTFDVYCISI